MWAAIVVLWVLAVALVIRDLQNAADESPCEQRMVRVVIRDLDGEPTAILAAPTWERLMELVLEEMERRQRMTNPEPRRATWE